MRRVSGNQKNVQGTLGKEWSRGREIDEIKESRKEVPFLRSIW